VTRLILGHRPSSGSHDKILESSTTRGLDRLMYDWRCHFEARNLFMSSEKGHVQDVIDAWELDQWVRAYDYSVIVTLGQVVAETVSPELGRAPWLSTAVWRLRRNVTLLKLPHTSGRNRWYNDPDNVRRASEALKEICGV
jgi:hypothetical protein